MDINKIANQLATAYTKAVCQRPADAVAINIYRALEDCPNIVRACNTHDELKEQLARCISVLQEYLTPGSALPRSVLSLGHVSVLYDSKVAIARAEIEAGDEFDIEEEPHPDDPVSYWLVLKNGDEIARFDTERGAEAYLAKVEGRS